MSEQEQAEHVLEKLHCGYEGLITEQVRGLKNGLLEHPKNLNKAFSCLRSTTTITVFRGRESLNNSTKEGR